MSARDRIEIGRLARFVLVAAKADHLAAFYERALGFRRRAANRLSGRSFESLMGVTGGATSVTLGLGRETVELLQFDRPGRSYPEKASSSDLIFQHFAIIVADMGAAFRKLSTVAGWTAISSGGPQRLPETSGGVTAFKFRDPEGHPLELLSFPVGKAPPRWRADVAGEPCLGIDHSAISVADSARSIAFYEGLGLSVSARSLNRGPEQERLDGAREPPVDVIALAPAQDTPHIELLRYRADARDHGAVAQSNDIAATRLVLETRAPSADAGGIAPHSLIDPDGHRLLIVPPSA
ncbi:VOC family protein [Methylocapsa sp. S129]|uniref:VOC family protein n=1 Tax=Methylocapsa sp. S129 TaxID=1641869 RepID=UPI00131D9F10|nr:VOC family protein [Methylocapsa sp. S129]